MSAFKSFAMELSPQPKLNRRDKTSRFKRLTKSPILDSHFLIKRGGVALR